MSLRLVIGLLALALCLLRVSTVLAADGVLLVQRVSSTEGGRTHVMTIRTIVSGDRIRSETTGPQDEVTTTIFDGLRGRILYLDDKRKTYRELTTTLSSAASSSTNAPAPTPDATAEMIRQAEDTMRKADETMRKSLERLPPEARARMEQQLNAARDWQAARVQQGGLGNQNEQLAAQPPEFRRVGTDRVGRWSCDRLDGYRDGRKEVESCIVASLSAIGVSEADSNTLLLLPARLTGQVSDLAEIVARQRQRTGYDGYAIRSVSLTGDRAISEILDVTAQVVAESLFEVPAGYRRDEPGRR